MSVSHTPPVHSAPLVESHDCHTAHFATRRLQSDTAIVTVQGQIDAANAADMIDYALRHAAELDCLVIDLSGVDFFGTAGFSALHTLNVRTAGENIGWVMLPSPAVSRLLRICDPDAALPVSDSVEAALSALQGGRPLLQLVPQPR
ncbi:anti-anti-sigma factor [Mycolicibacterium celeriflavum]|uniref:STAS domain-containing protein n=1 Tax=Mycolicibacterium celeriflavum TaxID=1249101 RepID=UPI0007FF140C|nr:STAS domain-containing protein [Mycolicibacterium celeriflavum]OBG23413.1 anti-anti-sigma factor [Mycolicibacterium celeriflavum]